MPIPRECLLFVSRNSQNLLSSLPEQVREQPALISQGTSPILPSLGFRLFSDFLTALPSAYNTVVPAGGKAMVLTDLAVGIPDRCYGRIAPRSSLAWKYHIDVAAGVIDHDYRCRQTRFALSTHL